MEVITKYKADDSTEFTNKGECIDYEALCAEVETLMARLPLMPGGTDFSNGSGYIQHDGKIFKEVREKLLKIAQRFCDHRWLQESIDKGLNVHPSYAGRIISEACPRPVDRAWRRISRTTNNFREYGQPYYRENPHEAKDVRLN